MLRRMTHNAEEPLEKLSKDQKIQLLRRLRRKLQSLVLSRNAPPAAIGALVSHSTTIHAAPGFRAILVSACAHT